MNLYGQQLKKYQWKNRIILILSNDNNAEVFKSQLEEFSAKLEGFKDRKLLIYKVLPKTYQNISGYESEIITDSELYRRYNPNDKVFKVILIGLDGGVKIEQTEMLTSDKLFSRIDGMPMRRAELKDNK